MAAYSFTCMQSLFYICPTAGCQPRVQPEFKYQCCMTSNLLRSGGNLTKRQVIDGPVRDQNLTLMTSVIVRGAYYFELATIDQHTSKT
ncbi:hypothetical protein L208DRAFT_1414546 [Tricholoma matsutake]|nr:hypothetical protein L208DRAFT_1414546 [Tricholoma matsutake 945]